MTPAAAPKELTELEEAFHTNWVHLTRREDEWYLGYSSAAIMVVVGICLIVIGHNPGGWINLILAAGLAVGWRWLLLSMRRRHRKLEQQRYPKKQRA